MQKSESNYLWVIAIVTMIADHVGKYVVEGQIASFMLQCVGRVGLPLWGYLMAQGFAHTSNPGAYFDRVLLVAVISTGPYWYLTELVMNPVFSLALGMMVLRLHLSISMLNESRYHWAPFLLLALPSLLGFDWYMASQVVLVGTSQSREQCFRHQIILLCIMSVTSPFNMLGLIGVYLIHEPRGVNYSPPRWLKYGFYPAHLAMIGLWIHLIE